MSDQSRIGPLHDEHVSLGAKLVDFGGWLMPVEYKGVLAEHQSVRESVGVFDVSHMGTIELKGEGAIGLANAAFALDLTKVKEGQAAYSLCLNADGGCIDDLLVYKRNDQDILVVPNASNSHLVLDAIQAAMREFYESIGEVEVSDVSDSVAIIAIQGPESASVLQSLSLPTDMDYMTFVDFDGQDAEAGKTFVVARSGYTGELGFELIIDRSLASLWWNKCLDAAGMLGGGPVGLGARDTLRLEMGYPLHGHELSEDRCALVAPIAWSIGWDKPDFVGKSALDTVRDAGPDQKIVGLKLIDRGIPRDGMKVIFGSGDGGREVGTVTSGTFSPTLKQGVALAIVDSEVVDGRKADDSDFLIDVRGKLVRAQRVTLPFVASNPRKF